MLHLLLAAAVLLPAFAHGAGKGKLDPVVQEALRRAPRAAGLGVAGGPPPAPVPQGTIDVLIRLAPGVTRQVLSASHPAGEFRPQAGAVVTARVPLALLESLERDPRVLQIAGPRRLKPTLHVARSSTTTGGAILGVLQNGLTDLSGVDGTGVIVGIVDTGIDWCHMDFRKDPGSPNVSRILNLWDQTDAAGPNPSGFAYGSEYTQANINTDLAAGCNYATVRSSDTDGHGTHVAGIAAGDGSATNGLEPAGKYTGLAPNADLVVVKTNFFNYGVVDAMNYIAGVAATAGKPAVINLSLGTQSGPHDGTDPFESAVGAVAANTPVTVAMGNDHADDPHAKTTIAPGGNATFTVSLANAGTVIFAEFWHDAADSYTVTVTPTCGTCSGSLAVTSGNTGTQSFGAAASITVYNSTTTHANGDDQVLVVINDPSTEVDPVNIQLTRTASGSNGVVDGFVDPAIDGAVFTNFLDASLTMTAPATANNVLAIGAHASLTSWGSGTLPAETLGEVATFSGRGPTRDNRQKPDVTAPGAGVASSSATTQVPPSSAASRLVDGRHMVLQGTSMAAPMAAGAVALKLQVQPAATPAQVRSWLQTHARTDTKTGSVPNNAYGYGKLLGTPKIIFSPTAPSATALGASSISFTWGLVEGATAYHLYYSTNTSYRVATVSAPPFVFTGLDSNFLTGLFVRGANITGEGPGATTPSTATYAADPGAAPTLTPHVSSATASYAACPAAPPGVCSGYRLVASTAPDFTGAQFSSSTPNRLLAQLQVAGLSASTTYYFRFATLNQFGAMSAIPAGLVFTESNFVPPALAGFTNVGDSSIQINWTSGGNPFGTTYRADASSDPAFGFGLQTQSGPNLFSALFSGLAVNTTYYFRVQATPGGPFLLASQDTLARQPTAPAAPFSGPQIAQVTASWGANGNPPGTHYRVEADDDPGFGSVDSSSDTDNAFADLTGLTANTTYYARVRALGHGGGVTAYTALGSTPTLTDPPVTTGFANQAAGAFRGVFSPATNPPGTRFLARIGPDAAFTTVLQSSFTQNAFADFSGLTANQTYYFNAAALNHSGVPSVFSAALATVTVPVPPAAAVPVSSTPAPGTLRFAWTYNGNASDSPFLAQVDDDPGFGSVDGTSATLNAFASFAGLQANTTYYARARTTSLGPPNPDSAFAALGAASSLTAPPGAAGVPILSVTYSSVTAQWTPLPAAPQTATCEGYRVEASTDPFFRGTIHAGPVVAQPLGAGGVAGLLHSTTYYLRVGALNWNGVGSYLVLGATRTVPQTIAVGTVTAAGVQFEATPLTPALPGLTVRAPPGAFPVGTILSLNLSVENELPAAKTNQAKVVYLDGSAFTLETLNALQPSLPVTVVLHYDPALLPAGLDPATLRLARYDPAAGQWSLLPTVVDAQNRFLAAQTGHFSLFGAFFAAAGTDLDAVQIFPLPWEPGGRDGRFNAVELTFSNLPAESRVRVFNLGGELVWEGHAGASGILTWHGRSRWGKPAGTGTYPVIIEGGGRRAAKRVVIVR